MSCSHIAPNGQPSLLAQQLLDTYQDPGLRDRVMSYIHSDNFKVQFNLSSPINPTKQGVEQLFNENENLANSVYEALGFTGNISDEQKQQQKADIERRRQEELDNLFSKTQVSTDKQLNTPVQKLSKEEVSKNIEIAKQQNKDLIEELENPEFLNDEKRNDEWDKKADELSDKLPQGVSFRITDGKVDFFDSQSYREKGFGKNTVQVSVNTLHNQTEKFEVGDNLQVHDGVRAIPAIVTKVNEHGKILEAKQEDGRIIISRGNIITLAPINDRLKINAKYDAELAKLNSESNPELANAVYSAMGFEKESSNISTFTNYSGAAQGGDTIWENVGKEFGLGKQVNYRPEDLKKLTKEQLQEVENAYQQAVKDLGRKPLDVNTFAGGLVRRDYLQAKAADTVFAISTIVESGQKDPKGYVNKTDKPLVAGGTGYAVQMAINLGKSVYVFDQNKNEWFVWNNNTFEKTETPTLTSKFAGIGTREINANGKQAIRDVYEKTTNAQITPQQKQEAQLAYSQYLATIFPDSKVKDVVYHGTDRKIENEEFKKSKDGAYGAGIYFDSFENAKGLAEFIGDRRGGSPNVIAAIVNITKFGEKDGDGIKEGTEVKVNEPNQIHILGSKQDIEGFKDFVQGKQYMVDNSEIQYSKAGTQGSMQGFKNFSNSSTNTTVDVNGEPTLGWVQEHLKDMLPDLPFKPANVEQLQAINTIQDFITHGNPQQWLTITGKAGTGKTTIVQEAIAPFVSNKEIVIAALSHKAKLVLQSKLDDRFGVDNIQGYSIAGLLGMGMDIETGKFSKEWSARTTPPPINDADIIIIDEASMVNEEALKLIMDEKPPYAKVIFLGDIGQLPPIRKKTTDTESEKPSPTFTTPNSASLLERVRQGEESPILPYADLFWNNSQSKNPIENPATNEFRKSIVSDKGSLTFDSSNNAFEAALPLYKQAVEQGNPDIVKTVVYRNNTRETINKKVRQFIFGENAKEQILAGELMMFNDNYTVGKTLISNSSEIQVKSVNIKTTYDGWKTLNIGFSYDGNPIQIPVLANEDKIRFQNHLDTLANKAKSMSPGPDRTKAWRLFYLEKSRFAPVDYSYAITSHKSQGSTYDVVLVGEADIIGVSMTTPKSKSQSIYTALTRARHLAIVLDGKSGANPMTQEAIELVKDKIQNSQKTSIPESTLKPNTKLKSIQTELNPSITEDWQYVEFGTYYRFNNVEGIITGEYKQGIKGKWKPLNQKTANSKYFQFNPNAKKVEVETIILNNIEVQNKSYDNIDNPVKLVLNEGKIKQQLTLDQLKDKIRKELFEPALKEPGKLFEIGYTDFAKNYKGNLGYGPRDIADVLDELSNEIPSNLKLSETLKGAMANSPNRIRLNLEKLIEDQGLRVPVNADGKILYAQLERMSVPILDDNGNTIGLYDEVEQDTAFQTIMWLTYPIFVNNSKTPVLSALTTVLNKLKKMEEAAKINPVIQSKYSNIIRSFALESDKPSFVKQVFNMFELLKYKIPKEQQIKIEQQLAKDKNTPYIPPREYNGTEQTIDDTNSLYDFLNAIVEDATLEDYGTEGRGVKKYDDVSFEIDQRDTASTRMKMFLSTIEESEFGKYEEANSSEGAIDLSHIQDITKLTLSNAIQANGKKVWHNNPELRKQLVNSLQTQFNVIPYRNSLQVNQLVEFDSLFENALSTLAGQSTQTIENYVKLLRESGIPNLITLANKLDGIVPGKLNSPINEQLRNEFVKVFSKQYNPFLLVLSKLKTDTNGNEYNEIRLMDAQRGSQIQTIVKDWQESNKLSPMMTVSPTGVRTLDTKRAAERHFPFIQAYNIVFNKLNVVKEGSADYNEYITILKELLKKVGYANDAQVFIQDANGERTWMKKQFKAIFSVYGINLTDEMINGLLGKVKGKPVKNYDGSIGYTYIDAIERLTKNTKKTGNLAQQFAFTAAGQPNGLFSIFFSKAAGITSEKDIDEGNIEEGEEQATLNNPLYTESTTMKILAGIAAKYIPVIHSSTHKSIEGKKIWDYSNNTALSKRIQALKSDFNTLLEQYNDTDLISKDGSISEGSFYLRKWKEKPDYFDKFNLYYLEGLRFGGREKGTTRQRMSDREQILTSILAFQNGGRDLGHFMSLTHSDKTMTPMFNNIPKLDTGIQTINKQVLDEYKQLFFSEYRRIAKQSAQEFNDARYDEGKKYFFFLPQFNKASLEARIGQSIGKSGIIITPQLINTLWNSNGSIVDNPTAFVKPLEALLHEHINNLTENALNVWIENGITPTYLDRNVVKKIQKGYVKPDTMTDDDYSQKVLEIAARDYAINHFLWNTNMSMLFYGDPATTWKGSIEETMKEYTKRLAKDIAPGQDLAFKEGVTYNTITLEDVEPSEKYITELGISNKSNGTDAQELTTVQEHLDVMYAGGLINQAKYQELSKVIKDSDNGYYEFSKEQLDIIMQPMKPVYAGLRAPINGAMLYDYVKSSSYPLLPQFTKGMEIDNLRTLMENNNIQRANFISAKKIGAPVHSAELFTKDGKFKDDPSFKTSIQTLDRTGFRIQQDVPYDEEKEAIKIVSQMNKLIMEGLPDTTFTFPDGRTFNARELRKFKEQIRKDMLDMNLEDFMHKIGAKKLPDGTWSKANKQKITNLLKQEAEARGYSKNEVDVLSYLTEKGDFEVPIFLHPSVEKFESLLMSMIKKVSETKMPGKSYVQASSVGYVKQQNKADTTNVVWVGDFNPTKALRHQQLITNADGSKTVIPAQVIMPFNFFYENGEGNSVKAKIEDYTITDENGKKTIDMERVPKELLQLIGARIPNQGHNLMVALEIVGFTPETMGDIIIVPSAITGQMSSDFDVDKLYTYKRPYQYKAGVFLNDTAGKAGLQGNYFDVHWSVLTNPEMYKKVLNPLDKPDLKDMNKRFTTKAPGFYNYFDVTSQLSDFQRGKDAKALVGLTSLSVTFNSVIQDKDLKLGSYVKLPELGGFVEDEHKLTVYYNGEKLDLTTMSGNGTNLYGDSIRTKHDNLTTIQSGAVDNAKDRTLDNLNITVSTYPAMAALHQLQTKDGKIVNIDFSTALTTQEALWEFSREMRQGNDSLSKEYNKDLKNSVLSKLKNKYRDLYFSTATNIKYEQDLETEEFDVIGQEPNDALDKLIDKFEISTESLQKSWDKWQDGKGNTAEYAIEQLAYLKLFEKLLTYGERLAVLQKTFNQDTNGAGPSIVYAIQQQSNYDNIFKKNTSKVFLNEDSIANNTEQGHLFKQLMDTAINTALEIFPIYAMSTGIEQVLAQTGKKLADVPLDTQKTIIRAIRSFSLTGTDIFGINIDAERSRLLNGSKEQPSLAIRLNKWKQKLSNNYFLQRLQTNINILGKGPDTIVYENAKTVRLDDEKNVSAFMALLSSPNQDEKLLAEDLIRYTYLLNPQNGPTSFIKHIPTSYLVATKFAEDMRELMNTLPEKTESEVFQCQVFQHNPTLTPQISSEQFGNFSVEGQDYPEWFIPENPEALEIDSSDGKTYAKYIHYRSSKDGKVVLYRLKGEGANLIYQRIDTLGKGDKTEYNAKATTTIRSIFSENRALQEWTNLTSVAQALTNQVDKMIGLTEDKNNAYANWGLPAQGKMLNVNKTLDNLSEDRTIPEYYRTVAKVLGHSSQTHEVYSALEALGIGLQPFTIKIGNTTGNELGYFKFSANELVLRPEGNKLKAAETLLHEMSHQRTSALAYALGYATEEAFDKMTPEIKQQYDDLVQEFKKKNPELYAKFTRLDKIRFEALQEFRKRMEADGIDLQQLFKDVKDGKLKSSNHQLLYGLQNLQEFISHVYSNKEVMQFLNTVESKESRTFVQQIWDLLSDIFVQLGEFIGTKVNDKSLLKEAYTLTMNLNNIQATEQYGIKIQNGQVVPTTLSINSQAKAEQLKDHIEHTYQQQVNHTTTLSQHLLNITDMRLNKSAEVEMSETLQKVLDKMSTQVSELNKILSTIPKTEEEKERQIIATRMKKEIQADIEEMTQHKADIEEMTQHKNLLELGTLGAKQLDWVKNILTKSKPNVTETMLAMNLLNMWYDLDKTIYDGTLTEVNQDFADMVDKTQGLASRLRAQLLAFGNNAIRELGRQRGLELTLEDLGINLKDMDSGSAYFITLSRNGNKAIQLITSIAQEAANNTDEEMTRLRKRLNKLEKLIDSIPGKKEDIWNKFIQQSEDGNAWGLVQALSADWYKFKSGNLSSLRTQLYNTNTKLKRGTGKYISTKRIAFNKFWEEINKTAVVVDIRYLLNLDTGERVDTNKSKKEYERLLELVGSKEVVDEAINKSIENYKEYMEHKAQYFDTTQQMQLTEEEVKAVQLTSEQLGTLTEEQQKEELQKLLNKALEDKIVGYRKSWIAHNSPATFIDTNTKNASVRKLNHNMSFLPEFLPKKTSGLFDESYSNIQGDDKLKTIYSELVSMSELFRSYLPPSTQEKLHDNFLPVVTNDDVADFFGQLSKLNASKAGQHVLKQFSVTQYDKDRVHKDEIPVNFIFRNGKDVADLNKNLPKIFEMFGNMATHYKNMRPVQEVIETFEILLKDAMVNRTEGRDNGTSLNRLSEALTFYKEMMVFKKPKKLELVSDTPVYSINPVTNRKIEKRVVEIKKELDDIDEKILDNIQDDNTELKDRKEVLEKELSEYEKNARYLAGSKAADVLIGINQLKALSYNPFSAVNNMTFGVLSAFMHAYGKVDYTPKQLRWGFSQMRGSVGKYLTFGSVNSNEATKIRNIMDRIGVISEVMETMYGKSNLQSGEKAMWKKAIDPYAWQKSGDYLHKGAMVLAMMQNKKVKVTENGVEKEIPLYEALNSDGEWNSEKYGENKAWSSDNINEQTEWNKFRDKSRKVAIIVHGNQDKNAPLLAKRYMLGRLVGQFRMSWLSEGVNTRFGKEYYDQQLERDVKGRYRTYADLGVVGSLQTIFSQLSSAFVKSDPFAGKVTRKGNELTEVDKENMRKNLAELVYIVGFLAALQMVKLMGPSEEEKKRRRKKGKDSINYNRLALNMLMRSYQDLTLYTSPSVFDQVTGNVVPSLTVINDARKAIGAIVELPFTDKKDAEIKATKKVFKAVPFLNLYNKIDYMMNRDISAAAR